MSDLIVEDVPPVLVEIHKDVAAVAEIVADGAAVLEVRDPSSALTVFEERGVEVVQVVTAGPQGPRGLPGAQGPVGPQGPFAPIFEQHFAAPALVWVIHHDLDVMPVVTVYDENHDEISGDVSTPDRNTVVVTFEVPMSGTARLKA